MKAGLVQLSVTDDPAANLPVTLGFIREAASAGADFVLTPECTNLLSSNRAYQNDVLRHEEDDLTLAALRAEAEALGIWLLIGSLGLKTHDADGRFANRSFLIGPQGQIVARYDKIHMFDVDVSETERYRESEGYRPGTRAVLTEVAGTPLGMAICYDLRFPHLFRRLAQAGAQILSLPAAFNDTTGASHWESLIRARAIENTCFVLAPAQCGTHAAHGGRPRRTWGHSLAVAPWGEVLADGGTEPGVTVIDIDLARVAQARVRVPSLTHDRDFEGP
ncbi:carbon-nitrogen hydrolase family protein [Sinirhodobacter sp. WL0062]|uniref:Carbon-nitrogen hydrolase family protein n=1 Tax=Rhodobacter flavimaris TaxID=2907145 RepID=A0ABS8YUP5_9RHOB|nr:carbon-nitrogen hydrolase family protein [Sinirhodobacter sp. WL0062]MCE5973208.1 carbon-nitrogen hydrolase family protein [Sinirhodobacter sp. WL0062]